MTIVGWARENKLPIYQSIHHSRSMCYESFVKNPKSLDVLLKDVFPPLKTFIFKNVIGFFVKRQLWGQGMGRHTDAEIWAIGRADLRALANFLGMLTSSWTGW